jgi:hypothetical protein
MLCAFRFQCGIIIASCELTNIKNFSFEDGIKSMQRNLARICISHTYIVKNASLGTELDVSKDREIVAIDSANATCFWGEHIST